MKQQSDKVTQKKLTPLVAFDKIKNWCAYQERSHQEVRNKLYEYGLVTTDVEEIITQLIEENFLNEQRFAMAFVSGKFRIKKWGRKKIKAELKFKKVDEYCINKALLQIDSNEYFTTLEKIIERKIKETKEPNKIKKQFKIVKYAISRGYEQNIIMDVLNNLEN